MQNQLAELAETYSVLSTRRMLPYGMSQGSELDSLKLSGF